MAAAFKDNICTPIDIITVLSLQKQSESQNREYVNVLGVNKR